MIPRECHFVACQSRVYRIIVARSSACISTARLRQTVIRSRGATFLSAMSPRQAPYRRTPMGGMLDLLGHV